MLHKVSCCWVSFNLGTALSERDYWVIGLHGSMNKELGSVSNQDDDGDKIGTNLHM